MKYFILNLILGALICIGIVLFTLMVKYFLLFGVKRLKTVFFQYVAPYLFFTRQRFAFYFFSIFVALVLFYPSYKLLKDHANNCDEPLKSDRSFNKKAYKIVQKAYHNQTVDSNPNEKINHFEAPDQMNALIPKSLLTIDSFMPFVQRNFYISTSKGC